MRIIAGTHKGRRLTTPAGASTRPTSDRAREALFSLVGPVDDAVVLDLFAGSGALGLEALSRGARRCTFVDSDRTACRAISTNLARLDMTGAIVLQREVLQVLREEATAGRRYDLILLDPPYETWTGLVDRLAEALPPVVTDAGLVVVETAAKVEPHLPFDQIVSRRYGSARITLFAP